ncbi:MAG: class I SAM-dependent methyltransferase [Actinomycetota bacterium]
MTTITDRAPCLLCASSRSIPAFTHPSPLRRCPNCGLVSTTLEATPTPSYGEGYFFDGGYRSYFARATQWRYEARQRLRWLRGSARPRTLFEIGCAGGFFLEAARDAGIAASGVEASEPAARYAHDVLGVPVVGARFEDADLDGPFDAVCAFHVLEHVDDPRAFLVKARELIASGGWLALEVPNIESAAAHADGIKWPGLQPQYHRWHFAPPTLTRLVEETGFRVTDCDTVSARFYTRPARRVTTDALAGLRAAVRSRSFRTVDPRSGDHVRLLAGPLP